MPNLKKTARKPKSICKKFYYYFFMPNNNNNNNNNRSDISLSSTKN